MLAGLVAGRELDDVVAAPLEEEPDQPADGRVIIDHRNLKILLPGHDGAQRQRWCHAALDLDPHGDVQSFHGMGQRTD